MSEPMKTMSNEDKEKALIFFVDFCGVCAGSCQGCLLTASERALPQAFAAHDVFAKGLKEAIAKAPKEAQGPGSLAALGLGRGNMLALGPKDWESALKLAQLAKSLLPQSRLVVECSTSLVGKIKPQIKAAQEMVAKFKEEGLDLRWQVIGNTDLFSASYWENLELFFEELEAFRAEPDGGDILVLNLRSDKLPDAQWLAEKIQSYRFPVNVALLPFHRLAGEPKAEHFTRLEEWMEEFCALAWGSQDMPLAQMLSKIPRMSLAQGALALSAGAGRFQIIGKDGAGYPGLFSPLGDVDMRRLGAKLTAGWGDEIPEPMGLAKIKACQGCEQAGRCAASGAYAHALMNAKAAPEAALNGKSCLSGIRLAARWIEGRGAQETARSIAQQQEQQAQQSQ